MQKIMGKQLGIIKKNIIDLMFIYSLSLPELESSFVETKFWLKSLNVRLFFIQENVKFFGFPFAWHFIMKVSSFSLRII